MKVLLAFAYFFGSVLLPIGVMFFGVAMAPPAWVVEHQAIGAMEGSPGDWAALLPGAQSKERFSHPGTVGGVSGRLAGGTVRALLCQDEKQCKGVFDAYVEEATVAPGAQQFRSPSRLEYRHPHQGVAGRIERVGRLILHAEGSDPEELDRLVEACGLLKRNPEVNWMTSFFGTTRYLPHVLSLALLYAAFQLRIWNRVGSWAANVPAKEGVTPVSEAELRERLLAVNDQDLPFQIVEKKGRKLEATWRLADAKWAGVLSLNSVKEVRVIQLRLCQERNVCHALDIGKSLRASADGLAARFSITGFLFRGITFAQREHEIQYGFTFRDGKVRFEKVYEYKFDHEDLRGPIVEIVTGSGWHYRPVLFISRILGG
ncbi:MAG: hypothetical protein ACUVS3_04425 [Thermodesulfobacteriota bacterium]